MLKALLILRRHWQPLVAVLATLAIVAAVLLYGSHKYDQGVRDEQAKQAVQAFMAAKDHNAMADAVRSMPGGAALSELRRDWSRD